MANEKPNVFVINIHPENWDECLNGHRFGIRADSRHPQLNEGDLFLVRRTGRDYGVMGLWSLVKEEYVTSQDEVPWVDYEYEWQQWFEPIADFQTPVSEEFSGLSKFSEKLRFSAMRLVGSAVHLNDSEATRYFSAILAEKEEELSIETFYNDEKKIAKEIVAELLKIYQEKPKEPVPTIQRKERDKPVGEPINFRGMVYAPLNEAGVVLLFSKVMSDLGVIYKSSPSSEFDMVGRIKSDKGFERKHFEFEYRSSNFKLHQHNSSIVDYIACWEHDWVQCPDNIEVIELREVIKELPAEFK